MRTVNIKDAEFIFLMRQNELKTKYLSKVNDSVEDQKKWIQKYKQREADKQEFYFVIESKEGEKEAVKVAKHYSVAFPGRKPHQR